MPSHGTASAYEIPQFVVVSNAVTVALPKVLDGIDPKLAIACVHNRGEALERHLRRFFDPSLGEPKRLRPRYIVPIQVPVNHDRKWDDAVSKGGPDTPCNYDIRKVGHLYVAERRGVVLTSITLLNFGQNIESSDRVLESVSDYKLGRPMDPWECFALGEHRPNLHRELGFEAITAVSLQKCEFRGEARVPCLWWSGDGRRADLRWFAFRWSPRVWFGFVRE